jgi:hypothetical protein
LKVLLPKDRNREGRLVVVVDDRPIQTFNVLGRGSRGSGETQFLSDGDTPTGVYQGTSWEDTATKVQHSYGPNGQLNLSPISGNAKFIYDVIGRDLFRIHGGDFNRKKGSPWYKRLNPTHGCLRLSNEDIKILYRIISAAASDDTQMMSIAPTVWVNIQEGSKFEDSDDGLNQCSLAPYSFLNEGNSVKFTRVSK